MHTFGTESYVNCAMAKIQDWEDKPNQIFEKWHSTSLDTTTEFCKYAL